MCHIACHFVCHLKLLISLMCAMCATKKYEIKILEGYFFQNTFCFLMPEKPGTHGTSGTHLMFPKQNQVLKCVSETAFFVAHIFQSGTHPTSRRRCQSLGRRRAMGRGPLFVADGWQTLDINAVIAMPPKVNMKAWIPNCCHSRMFIVKGPRMRCGAPGLRPRRT